MIAGKTGKPLVGVVGFLGRGNAGDEAMFQCIHEAFSPDFDIVAVVDKLGACPGFWDWYPYTHCGLVHVGDIHHFIQPMAGLIVGGGIGHWFWRESGSCRQVCRHPGYFGGS